MYQIISMTGEILAETDSPHYVKLNSESGAWISANESDAESVVVGGKRFCIYGEPFLANADDVVFVKKIDGAAKIQKLAQKSEENSADILDVIESLCESDGDKLDIIEAVVELDRKLNILYGAIQALNQKVEAMRNANG